MPGSSVSRNTSASALSTRSGGKPWLAVMAEMRVEPRSGQITPGADEAEMRRLDQPLDLFAGIVGEREDDPVRARSLFLGAHLDAADDAVRARRRRDEQTIPHRIVAFDRLGEVDHLRVERDPHRFNGFGRAQARRERGKQDQMAQDPMAKLMRCARQDWFACGMDRPGPDGSSLEEETNSQLSTRVTDHSSRF